MNSQRVFLTRLLFPLILLSSCKKEEGEGGSATITGKVFVREYEDTGSGQWKLIKEYYAGDERVYIVYGSDETFGDDTRTFYDGTYRFRWLRRGIYEVYAYSDDTTDAYRPPRQIAVRRNVTVESRRDDIRAGEIEIARVVRQ